jgi:putative Holliday junction resolvase
LGRIAGIDFGTKRIGLAISDASKILARALPTLHASKNKIETVERVASALKAYIDLELIVLGLPLLLSGKEGDMATQVRAFEGALKEKVPCPILLWDERLTSAGVEKMLISFDLSRKQRAALSDELSAVSILQNYLDSLRFRN